MKKPQKLHSVNVQILKPSILLGSVLISLLIPSEATAKTFSMEMTFMLFATFFFAMFTPYFFTKGSLQSDERICKNNWKDPICIHQPFSYITPLAQSLCIIGSITILKALIFQNSFSLTGGLFLTSGLGILIGIFIILKIKE